MTVACFINCEAEGDNPAVKILSVDDSTVIRKIIKSSIDTLGYELLEAGNGEEALRVLGRNDDVDLIILDWNMPVKDGFVTLQEIKRDSRFMGIPVMMLTTESEKVNIVKAIQAGANHYMVKPFNQEDLLIKIMECLGVGEI